MVSRHVLLKSDKLEDTDVVLSQLVENWFHLCNLLNKFWHYQVTHNVMVIIYTCRSTAAYTQFFLLYYVAVLYSCTYLHDHILLY